MVGGERRVRTTSFLLVLTGMPVVTLSSAGRARISLKHGLGSTKSRRSRLAAACSYSSALTHPSGEGNKPQQESGRDDERVEGSNPFSCSSLRRSIMTLEKKRGEQKGERSEERRVGKEERC